MKSIVSRRSWIQSTALAALVSIGLGFTSLTSEAAKKTVANVHVVPTITGLVLTNGQLLASGNVVAEISGQVVTQSFSGIPVTLALADPIGTNGCPSLDLALGPINLNLLGLIVETSPICLEITAFENGGLLGDLLCSVGGLLGQGLPLDQILSGVGIGGLPGLDPVAVTGLLDGLTDLLNTTLGELLNAVLENIVDLHGRECAILNLALGPLDLNVLGLEVVLDDCNGGPVLVDITARRGQLLGNLLCGLLHGGLIDLGDLLGDILGALDR